MDTGLQIYISQKWIQKKTDKGSLTNCCFRLCLFWIYFAKTCCILKLHWLKSYWAKVSSANDSTVVTFFKSWSSTRKKKWKPTCAILFHSLSVFTCRAAAKKNMLVWQRTKHIPRQMRTNMFHPRQHHPQSAYCVFTCKPSVQKNMSIGVKKTKNASTTIKKTWFSHGDFSIYWDP